jgi:hypothetical protein
MPRTSPVSTRPPTRAVRCLDLLGRGRAQATDHDRVARRRGDRPGTPVTAHHLHRDPRPVPEQEAPLDEDARARHHLGKEGGRHRIRGRSSAGGVHREPLDRPAARGLRLGVAPCLQRPGNAERIMGTTGERRARLAPPLGKDCRRSAGNAAEVDDRADARRPAPREPEGEPLFTFKHRRHAVSRRRRPRMRPAAGLSGPLPACSGHKGRRAPRRGRPR